MQLAYTSLDLFAKIMLDTGFRLLMGGMFGILGYHFKSRSPWRVNKVHTWKQPHEQRADLSRCSSCAEHGSEEERRLRSMIGIRSDGGLGITSIVPSCLLMYGFCGSSSLRTISWTRFDSKIFAGRAETPAIFVRKFWFDCKSGLSVILANVCEVLWLVSIRNNHVEKRAQVRGAMGQSLYEWWGVLELELNEPTPELSFGRLAWLICRWAWGSY